MNFIFYWSLRLWCTHCPSLSKSNCAWKE